MYSAFAFIHPVSLIYICLGLALFIALIYKMPVLGRKCPVCAAHGIDQWVLPGKNCPRCGHPC